jgi:hypothetical protein
MTLETAELPVTFDVTVGTPRNCLPSCGLPILSDEFFGGVVDAELLLIGENKWDILLYSKKVECPLCSPDWLFSEIPVPHAALRWV